MSDGAFTIKRWHWATPERRGRWKSFYEARRNNVRKPTSLNEIWAEKDLCTRLDLPVTKSGRSLQLNGWVRGGLRYVEKSGRRYFFEQDVIEYLWGRSLTDQPE